MPSRPTPTHPSSSTAAPRPAERGSGLYGSSPDGGAVVRTAVAELVGTFLLVLVGTSVATSTVQGDAYDALAIAIAFGLTLTACVAGLGHVSGSHVNPAITIALAVTGAFPWRLVPSYVGAQLAGACAASLVVWGAHGDAARTGARLGAPSPAQGVGTWQAVLVEVVITFLLVLVVCAVATDDRVPPAVAPLAAGAALAAAVLVGLPITGGAVNPARALGPFVVSGYFPLPLVYLLAPVVGGLLGALTYQRVLEPAEAPAT